MRDEERIAEHLGKALVMADVPATVSVVEAAAKPIAAIIQTSGPISVQSAERIKKYLDDGLKDTAFAGIKTFILADGMRLTFIDKDGHVCNKGLHERVTAREHEKAFGCRVDVDKLV